MLHWLSQYSGTGLAKLPVPEKASNSTYVTLNAFLPLEQITLKM
jgi:hypothetical protein